MPCNWIRLPSAISPFSCTPNHKALTCVPCWLPVCSTVAEAPRLESRIYSAVAQLRTLHSLHLTTSNLDPTVGFPEALRPHATCVARLSALTALTSLYLNLANYYEHHGDSWERQQQDGEQHGAWCEVREAHRTSLLSALRCMPQLQHLDCPTLWLRASELPAALTALTSLTLGGLLPPPAGGHPLGLRDAGHGVALPPRLQEMVLQQGISPRALAELQPPPSSFHLDVSVMSFGMSDVLIDGHVRPEAVAVVGAAVRTLVACRSQADDGPHRICITEDGSPCLLLPREESPSGHMEWIQQLQGLDVFKKLELESISLSTADLCCLGQVLPGLKGEGDPTFTATEPDGRQKTPFLSQQNARAHVLLCNDFPCERGKPSLLLY